jgi:hypothetical protein
MHYEMLYSEIAPVCFTNIQIAALRVLANLYPLNLNVMINEGRVVKWKNWIRR